MSVIRIDGVEYELDDLSEKARGNIAGIQAADRRAQDLQEQLVLLQAARNTYIVGLKASLAEDDAATIEP